MRRIDLIKAAQRIELALKDSKIGNYIFIPNSEKVDIIAAIEAFQKYSKHFDSFGDVEKDILAVFGLIGLESPKIWGKIVTGERTDIRELSRPFIRGIHFIEDYLSAIVNLLKQDHLEYISTTPYGEAAAVVGEGKALLTVILPENENKSSQPERLVQILESISLFYKTTAKLLDAEESGLSVAAIDSGSDKSFDFLGAAKVVTAVKELIIELWDRIVFYRERKMHERIELISKSLPIIEKINNMESEGKLGREQCEILRRNIHEGTTAFLKTGAILPEFEQHNTFNPRVLTTTEPKLLTSPDDYLQPELTETNRDARERTGSGETIESLSERERLLLKELLEKEAKRNVGRGTRGKKGN